MNAIELLKADHTKVQELFRGSVPNLLKLLCEVAIVIPH